MNSVDLNPSFTASISLWSGTSNLHSQTFQSNLLLQRFLNRYVKPVESPNIFKAMLIPIRTDNWKDFAKDLFLPTYINRAREINFIALSVIAIIFDLATLAPRLVFSIPRVLYNRSAKETSSHPVLSLIDRSQHQQALSQGIVKFEITYDKTEISGDRAIHQTVKGSTEIAIRPIPGKEIEHTLEGRVDLYVKLQNQWKRCGSIGPSGSSLAYRSIFTTLDEVWGKVFQSWL